MKPETKIALEESIQKWEDIVRGKGADCGSMNCSLCHRFLEYTNCTRPRTKEQCPVAIKAGVPYCIGTPYIEWTTHHISHQKYLSLTIECDECRKLAEEELAFLRSLLPKD